MNTRITPEEIDKTFMDFTKGFFVFGSNLAGRHGAGAAKFAYKELGAIYGKGEGIQGQTYALPTMDYHIKPLELNSVKHFVNNFYATAAMLDTFRFFVTEVACGLGGRTPEEIAPLFAPFVHLNNVSLPLRFWKVLVDCKYIQEDRIPEAVLEQLPSLDKPDLFTQVDD